MGKSVNQKLKLLYLLRILNEKTDEEHALTVPQMIQELSSYGIKAERKTIYDDLEALENFGVDLVCRRSKQYYYYVGNKTFELPELKLLADAVASSKFITLKKSDELIKKIESLASIYEAKQIHRQVIVTDRVKAINETIYYNVDKIHHAIADGRQISFKYFDIGIDKKKHFRDGNRTTSPYALSWDDENYYLIGFYEKYNDISHFRVDRMESIEILDNKIVPPPSGFNLAEYTRKVFSMFGGDEQEVKLQFNNCLIGAVFDKFGKEITVIKADDESFIISPNVVVSPSFFGWLFQFGNMVKILSPKSVKENFLLLSRETIDQYQE